MLCSVRVRDKWGINRIAWNTLTVPVFLFESISALSYPGSLIILIFAGTGTLFSLLPLAGF